MGVRIPRECSAQRLNCDYLQGHTGHVVATGDEGRDRVEVLAVDLQRVRRRFPGAAVGQECGEPLRHVMEHGLYVLKGKAVYLLNKDWVEVQEGDFMWLRAFCPQACYAGGPGRFRYLLYKDVNRHAKLSRQFL
jgi:glyoxylate utilization-related uncharacterized protein